MPGRGEPDENEVNRQAKPSPLTRTVFKKNRIPAPRTQFPVLSSWFPAKRRPRLSLRTSGLSSWFPVYSTQHHVTLSPCHFVTLSSCTLHPVPSSWFSVLSFVAKRRPRLSLRTSGLSSQFQVPGTVLPCHFVTLSPSHMDPVHPNPPVG